VELSGVIAVDVTRKYVGDGYSDNGDALTWT
jgi:hypothetical protein